MTSHPENHESQNHVEGKAMNSRLYKIILAMDGIRALSGSSF